MPDVDARVERYAAAKQEDVVRLIEEGRFMAFPDALRCILAVKDMGIPLLGGEGVQPDPFQEELGVLGRGRRR